MLTRDEILAAANSLAREPVDWPGGGQILVQEFTGLERARWSDMIAAIPDTAGKNEKLQFQAAYTVLIGAVNDDGSKLFSLDDAQTLAGFELDELWPVAERIMALSELGADAEEAEAKNS